MTRFLAVAATVTLGLAVASAQSQFDYPQWRGQRRDGAASAFAAPDVWPTRLHRIWRADVGAGYGTPVLVGPTVYVFVRQDNEEALLALDAATGRTLWRTGYPAPYAPSRPAAAHGAWPKATPLYSDGRLFTLGINGVLSAFAADRGTLLWQSAAPPDAPLYGAASSPVAYRDLVIAHPGNYGPLTAFDARTGATRWTSMGHGFFASPVVADIAGVTQLVTVTTDGVEGVAADTGTSLWKWACAAGSGAVTPIVDDGTVIVAGLDMGVLAVRPRLRDNSWHVDMAWETRDVNAYTATPVLDGGILFGLSQRNSGQFFALDAATGKVLWRGQPRTAANSAIVKAPGVIFFLKDDAELIVARPSRLTLDVVARYITADTPTWAQPLISGNRLFVKDASTLTLWTF